MYFKNRQEAGNLLAKKFKKYIGKDVVVYGMPRGGVITALEIAKYLHASFDLIITRKIGHPLQPEYAIGAVDENEHLIGTKRELETVDQNWLKQEIKKQRAEARRRREIYLKERLKIPLKDKIAILVDDGIATGLTLRVGILEIKDQKPQKIIIAVPVAPKSTAVVIGSEVDEFVALDTPDDSQFLGSIGAYYEEFSPIEDKEVISAIKQYDKEYADYSKQTDKKAIKSYS